MKKVLAASFALAISATSAFAADLVQVSTSKSVDEAMDALEAAVGNAGATVFARVDHAQGAQNVDMELADAQLLIFGNPKLGTPAMQDDIRAGLYLPLKVLAYEGADGQVYLTYEDPSAMLGDLDVGADAEYLKMMTGALNKLTTAAAN
ncbi:DUF302 domain-containing protein [Litoreibacter roseus]|uniref:Membrane protein n=1 Tax=Litoreibacter roseus TaxID=2601869 RepID=A0A6N6JKB6_9RHOB|nr:DUF302 domain-containing protein [Litoreibacter roseus]GFE65642.1 membrane protein [Litoreibacter roseus]